MELVTRLIQDLNNIDNFKRRIKSLKTLQDFTFDKEACLTSSKDSEFTYF